MGGNIMAFIRATYDGNNVIAVSDSSILASGYEKDWITDDYVTDNLGVWDTTNNVYIPDGWHNLETDWIWPSDLDWSYYDAN
jgi:hypothetical protein